MRLLITMMVLPMVLQILIVRASTQSELSEDDPYAMADELHDVEGDTVLVTLSRKGDIMQLKQFFEDSSAEKKINEKGGMGHTALMAASISGQSWAVRFLLQHGADPNIADGQGYTPIHAAAYQGRYKVMEALLDSDVNPLHQHADGLQPLHRACAGPLKRHAKTVQVLLSSGKVKYNDVTSNGLNCELLTRNPDVMSLIAPQAMAQAKCDPIDVNEASHPEGVKLHKDLVCTAAEEKRAEKAAAALEAELEAMDDEDNDDEDVSRTTIRSASGAQVDEDGRVVVSAAETHIEVDWDKEAEDDDEDEDEDDYDLVDAEI
ncbi:protein phosphatase 1 regulatory subunit 12B, putative [Perkinsus marinus ATCC 50983]|uniref:Protein phosphatase 1 regulatory subunit 12B, putative n=1 Tax=Perkinsus marinus (strain ATCC 50983 / TXsc) TaxID=423536 RepID=C5KJI7_PERM5|nr:protein phosphatase 1 regulatory subunit 12B, putative [Perkinsus marinus ATCC 50983]EER15321.1 protein phosphatase 1 regulatory subunit 12B, putative [Perkinsus marinus ATCC 50983]|eukprot:XP_002783525.1 protein phosphatase 1 regulatory subunit 12B, putative [Perkinsus marinus ATCC 50983]